MMLKIIFLTLVTTIVSVSNSSEEFKEKIALRSNAYGHNCVEATANSKTSGVYEILVPSYSKDSFKVYCDATTQGGGWTVFLRRTDGSVDFNQNWNTYKKGFGNLENEFFLGLDKIHALTADLRQELLVVVEDFEGVEKFHRSKMFAIGDEEDQYILHTLGIVSGTAGDWHKYEASMKFSAYDRDNDQDKGINCAKEFNGGWWYNDCGVGNHLTGKYGSSRSRGVMWSSFRGDQYSLKKAVMMIRPRT